MAQESQKRIQQLQPQRGSCLGKVTKDLQSRIEGDGSATFLPPSAKQHSIIADNLSKATLLKAARKYHLYLFQYSSEDFPPPFRTRDRLGEVIRNERA